MCPILVTNAESLRQHFIALRKRKRLKIPYIAKHLRVTPRRVRELERRGDLRVSTAVRWAAALGAALAITEQEGTHEH